jgi:hypothetical protein
VSTQAVAPPVCDGSIETTTSIPLVKFEFFTTNKRTIW